jgi:hypothetical protein
VRLKPESGQAELEKRIREESDASRALNEAQTKVRTIESELRDMAPGRRLLQFYSSRSVSKYCSRECMSILPALSVFLRVLAAQRVRLLFDFIQPRSLR